MQSDTAIETIRYLLVDDEPLARQRMSTLLEAAAKELGSTHWQCIGEAGNGTQALAMINELQPDLVFLDIQMPGLQGFDVVELLSEHVPHIVFVTAYDEYALRAFEVHALDYLTKPVRAERLVQCLKRVQSRHHLQQQSRALETLRQERALQPLQRLSVRVQDKIRVLALSEIERMEAEDKVVQVFSQGQAYRTELRLDELEQRLDANQYLRIHRSHIVRIEAVRELIPWFSGSYCVKLADGTQLPVARRRVAQLKIALGKS